MKQGSSRYGNDFETKCREFIAKYGFEILAENETINCKIKEHKKPSHEIDLICVHSLNTFPFPPTYGISGEKFIISCKGGIQIEEDSLIDCQYQLACVKKNPKYSDVSKAVIVCQEIKPSIKIIPKNVYVWNTKYIHLLVEKMKIANMVKSSKLFNGELNFPENDISVIYNLYIGRVLWEPNKEITNLNLYIFNENPWSDVGKTETLRVIKQTLEQPPFNKLNSIQKIINIYSPSGIRTDLYSLLNKMDPTYPMLFFSKMYDLSIATWVPSVTDDSIF